MNKEEEDFPMKTVRELSLSSDKIKSKKKNQQARNSMTSAPINKHIEHQYITKTIFQKKSYI